MLKHESGRIYMVNEAEQVIAEITFPDTAPGVVNFNHTLVDPCLRGQGIADELMKAAADEVRRQGKKATATCSYAVKWLCEHEDYGDIIKD